MTKINIIQHGTDGMGHQLHGLLSCLALHNIDKYYFDGCYFINKHFAFDHIEGEVSLNTKKYMTEIVKGFIKIYNQTTKHYKKQIHSHEIYNIPNTYDTETIYSLDNCYYFDRIPITPMEHKQYLINIQQIKHLFINDKLPNNRLCKNNIVIHLRQGDAMKTARGSMIHNYNQQLQNMMPLLLNKYGNHVFYIHTDGDASFLTNILKDKSVEYNIFQKSEPILNVLSDFIHSKVFIAGQSGLSTVCTFLGDHELIIIPDDIKHSVPENIVRISDYE